MANADALRMRDYRRRRDHGGEIGQALQPAAWTYPEPSAPLTVEERHERYTRQAELMHQALAAWLGRQRSKNTALTYRRAWQAWCAWCVANGECWFEPRRNVGIVWVDEMKAAGLADGTILVRMTAVRQGILELACEGLSAGGDPFGRMKSPKGQRNSTTVPLADDEVHRALAAAGRLGGQYLTLMLLLSGVGLRASEAAQIVEGTVRDSPWGPVAAVVRKGGHEELVPVPAACVEAAAIDGWPLDGWLGVHERHRVATMVRMVGREAGVPGLHPHQFRHWHVTTALAAGVPLDIVQQSVDHQDPKTTMRYNRVKDLLVRHSAHTVMARVQEVLHHDG